MKLHISGLEACYSKYRALKGVSLDVSPGEVVSLVGPNGSGKSTLIKCIAGIMRPSSGTITLDGKDLSKMDRSEMARLIGYVPQSYDRTFFATVMEAVLLGRKPHIKWGVSQNDLEIVQRVLEEMNIGDLSGKQLDEISGGERQRVLIARVLAQEPGLFLFDEPTNNLDLKYQIEMLDVARNRARETGASVIISLHDLNLALNHTDRTIIMKKGEIFADGKPTDVLTQDNIREVYEVEAHILESVHGRYIAPLRVA
mgnify:CR=1 FL=1